MDLNREEEIVRQQVKAYNKYFITHRENYIYQISDGSYVTTKRPNHNFKLTDEIMEKHISNELTVGVFSFPRSAKFMCLDLDMEYATEKERQTHVINIIKAITNVGISRDYIHVSFSGKKGMHIIICFDKEVFHDRIYSFYSYILIQTDLTSTELEIRPLEKFAVKLPLALHKGSGVKSYFMDEHFNEIKDPLYITRIKQFPAWLFTEYAQDVKPSKSDIEKLQSNLKYNQLSPNKTKMLSNSMIMKIEHEGLQQKSMRNYCSVQLALFYRNQGMDILDANNKLDDWIKRQDTKFYNSSITFCLKENKKIIKWAYSKPIMFENSNTRNGIVKIYKGEIDRLLNLKLKSSRKILLAMMIHCKVWGNKNKEFAMTYEMIKFHTGIESNGVVAKALKHLKETMEINVVRNGHYENRISNMFSIKLSNKLMQYEFDIYDDIEYYRVYPSELTMLIES